MTVIGSTTIFRAGSAERPRSARIATQSTGATAARRAAALSVGAQRGSQLEVADRLALHADRQRWASALSEDRNLDIATVGSSFLPQRWVSALSEDRNLKYGYDGPVRVVQRWASALSEDRNNTKVEAKMCAAIQRWASALSEDRNKRGRRGVYETGRAALGVRAIGVDERVHLRRMKSSSSGEGVDLELLLNVRQRT